MTGTESLESSADSRERTILTTDVVGSTALLRRYPNDMMGAMDLHDQILHAAIRHHFGDPFRSTGDGVLARPRSKHSVRCAASPGVPLDGFRYDLASTRA